ncbi:RNA-binding protein Pasilla [Homalodisca vitripennis]|nr:RNA-binding protein Pasilla [Homalodisca vitripennis]
MAADSGMDTCPSPENPDSRKRPLDGDVENGSTKRSHYVGGGDGIYHFKILVPSIASGAIIGKGGETIAQLQKDTNARVKMSKANDFYPGTSERVCLISGSVDAIISVLTFIMEKIKEKPEHVVKNEMENKTGTERDKQVKILVPNSTAGMIIGKGGNYIKQVKEESGSYVQISQKAKDQSLQERCITVIGEMENNKKACMLILAKVMEDPQSGSCPNVSYADISGPVANYNPTGSPFAHPTGQNLQSTTFASTANLNSTVAVSQLSSLMLNGGLGIGGAPGLNLSLNLNSPMVGTNQSLTSQLLDQIKIMLRSSGCSEHVTAEISTAMATLAKYGILGMGLGLGAGGLGTGSYLGVSPMDATPAQANGGTGVFGPIGTSTPTRPSLDLAFDPFRHPTPASPPGASALNNNSFGLGAVKSEVDNKEAKKLDMEIAEVIVGAILGPGGRSLVEIQALSGASIQISKKGTFAPGTRNRVVSITGSPGAIAAAQILIEQRINEEEVKRNRQNPLGLLQ